MVWVPKRGRGSGPVEEGIEVEIVVIGVVKEVMEDGCRVEVVGTSGPPSLAASSSDCTTLLTDAIRSSREIDVGPGEVPLRNKRWLQRACLSARMRLFNK